MEHVRRLKKAIKGKTLEEKIKIAKKYVTFINPKNIVSGVYLIENFYIGRSSNIHTRIAHHIIEALSVEKSNTVYNREKLFLINKILKNRNLKVKVLDKDAKKEKSYIQKLYEKLPLVNIEFVTEDMIIKKQRIIVDKIIKKKHSVKIERFTNKFYVASIRVGDIFIFKIAPSEKYARTLLNKYMRKETPKKRCFEPSKNIKNYKYVAIESSKIKRVFLQSEDWEEVLKDCEEHKIKGFDDNILARKWLKLKIYTDI